MLSFRNIYVNYIFSDLFLYNKYPIVPSTKLGRLAAKKAEIVQL